MYRLGQTRRRLPALCALLWPRCASERGGGAAMEDDDGDTALFLEEAEAEAAAQLGDTAAEIYAKHRRAPVKRWLTPDEAAAAMRGGKAAQRAAYAWTYGVSCTSKEQQHDMARWLRS